MGLYLHKDILAAEQTATLEERDVMTRRRNVERETGCRADAEWLWERARKCTDLLNAQRNQIAECKKNLQRNEMKYTKALKTDASAMKQLASIRDSLADGVSKCNEARVEDEQVMAESKTCAQSRTRRLENTKSQTDVKAVCNSTNARMKELGHGYAMWDGDNCNVFTRVSATGAPTNASEILEQYKDEEACARHFTTDSGRNALMIVHTDGQKTGCVTLHADKFGKANAPPTQMPQEDIWLLNHRALTTNELGGREVLKHFSVNVDHAAWVTVIGNGTKATQLSRESSSCSMKNSLLQINGVCDEKLRRMNQQLKTLCNVPQTAQSEFAEGQQQTLLSEIQTLKSSLDACTSENNSNDILAARQSLDACHSAERTYTDTTVPQLVQARREMCAGIGQALTFSGMAGTVWSASSEFGQCSIPTPLSAHPDSHQNPPTHDFHCDKMKQYYTNTTAGGTGGHSLVAPPMECSDSNFPASCEPTDSNTILTLCQSATTRADTQCGLADLGNRTDSAGNKLQQITCLDDSSQNCTNDSCMYGFTENPNPVQI